MAYLNRATLIGNLGHDPEIRTNPQNGRKCVTFTLATSKRFREANGETKEITIWHNVRGWAGVAETFEKLNIRKGTTLYVEGEITEKTWTDSNGQKRTQKVIDCSNFQILTQRQQNNNGSQGGWYGNQDDDGPAF